MANDGVRLSIVIPAFNECGKIPRDVAAASAFLATEELPGEIILVDDGSTDGTAEAAVSALRACGTPGDVIRLDPNRGKGQAVRTGIAASRGEYVLFADSGVCIPYAQALQGLGLLESGGCDIANGSRHMRGSVIVRSKSLYRQLGSWMFRRTMPFFAGTPHSLTDTQCGFKMYRGTVGREIYSKCTCDGFMFDVEVILLAVRAGYRIAEFPVEWTSDPDSRLHPARYLPRMIREIFAIRREIYRNR